MTQGLLARSLPGDPALVFLAKDTALAVQYEYGVGRAQRAALPD